MIYSMTGFGSGRVEAPNLAVTVEAKTVNHRYLDVHVRLPSEFQRLEGVVRKAVSDTLRCVRHAGRARSTSTIPARTDTEIVQCP